VSETAPTTLTELRYETLPWSSQAEPPRSKRHLYAATYRAAVPQRVRGLRNFGVPSGLLTALDEATTAIARLDGEMGGELAPFESMLLRTESAASSQIENITASAKAIALAEVGETERGNASLVVANTSAMQAAVALADQMTEATLQAMHRTLLQTSAPLWAGRYRDAQVWIGPAPQRSLVRSMIGGTAFGQHEAVFVPPQPRRIGAAMRDLVAFMRRDDVPPLLQATIAHAQFETIHPFVDGNGRTGRALMHCLLRNKGVTQHVTVPVSAGLLTNTKGYFDALTAFRDGDAKPLVQQVADAALYAAHNGRQLVADLRKLRTAWASKIPTRRGSATHALADLLLRHPVVDSAFAQRALGVAAPNVNTALTQLEACGIVVQLSTGRRNRKWCATEVTDLLDGFGARSGRRR